MIDKEKLRYDLALQAAALMTLRELNKGAIATSVGLIPDKFLIAYEQYDEPAFNKKLDEIVEKLNQSK
ncbi:MAG: hypothetical protein IJK81_13645 [Selenomonadaceae bacterium]|nr:hypothetical protein [Selenomonadaceae bacterium]